MVLWTLGLDVLFFAVILIDGAKREIDKGVAAIITAYTIANLFAFFSMVGK